MKMIRLSRHILTTAAVAVVLSSCTSRALSVDALAPYTPTDASNHTVNAHSSMQANTSGQNLLYVSSVSTGQVYVFAYPQGALVTTLSGISAPYGECTDRNGDVFITSIVSLSQGSKILEYAHGGTTPIASLDDPGGAFACAVDPNTGNLAVANSQDSSNPYNPDYGDVAVYRSATGSPTMYYSSDFSGFVSCGYDNKKNLYLAAIHPDDPVHQVRLARLKANDTQVGSIGLDSDIYGGYEFQPSVQWDGKYMTLSSVPKNEGHAGSGVVTLYRLKVSGDNATVVSSLLLKTSKNLHGGQSWVRGQEVLGIYYANGYSNVATWRYPAGGKPKSAIKRIAPRSETELWGLAISPAASP